MQPRIDTNLGIQGEPDAWVLLYEDLKFWTGIDECETYGAD